jgi:hypothetical protein
VRSSLWMQVAGDPGVGNNVLQLMLLGVDVGVCITCNLSPEPSRILGPDKLVKVNII